MKTYYNIMNFGAISGSNELQTDHIQAAVDAAFLAGGGEVIVPAGVFRTATIRLRSNVVFHMLSGAVLEGSTNPYDYEFRLDDPLQPIDPADGVDTEAVRGTSLNPWYHGILWGFHAENIKILGDGNSVIDGKDVFDPQGEEGYRGPHAIQLTCCRNLEFGGYTVKNSANWAHNIHKCDNIFAHNLTVLGGHDGFHVRKCKNILIEDCQFYTGDDCIAGYVNENMVVRNCMMDCACSAMRLGGTDILVDHCRTHAPSRYGFRGSLSREEKENSAPTNEAHRHTQHTPFMYFCDFPVSVEKPQGNIVFQNCVFEQPNSFFRLRWGQRLCANRSLVDITFRNCKCTGVSLPIDLYCDENEPCTLRLIDVEISAREGCEDAAFMHADCFKQIYFDNVEVSGYRYPTILTKTEGEIVMKNSSPIAVKIVDELIDRYV